MGRRKGAIFGRRPDIRLERVFCCSYSHRQNLAPLAGRFNAGAQRLQMGGIIRPAVGYPVGFS
jgi:hypothetical protein